MTNFKTINIKGKEYVTVAERIRFLSEEIKDYSIITSYNYFPERKMRVVKAVLTIGENSFSGLAQEIETADEKKVNFSSALENAETSAVGRACAMAGIGVINGIASADEINKANNRSSYQPNQKPQSTQSIVEKIAEVTAAILSADAKDLLNHFHALSHAEELSDSVSFNCHFNFAELTLSSINAAHIFPHAHILIQFKK